LADRIFAFIVNF